MYRYRDKKTECLLPRYHDYILSTALAERFIQFPLKNETKSEKCSSYIIINNFLVKKKVIIFGRCHSSALNTANKHWKINSLQY